MMTIASRPMCAHPRRHTLPLNPARQKCHVAFTVPGTRAPGASACMQLYKQRNTHKQYQVRQKQVRCRSTVLSAKGFEQGLSVARQGVSSVFGQEANSTRLSGVPRGARSRQRAGRRGGRRLQELCA